MQLPTNIKTLAYEERVREIEHANFSLLVFSTIGGMGPSTTVTYRRLATWGMVPVLP